MFFSFHPAMLKVMSLDIKIHQISIDSKHKQCFDFIASDTVHYHLHCRKYADNSGHNEKYSMFFSFHPAMVQVMFFDIKIHQILIESKHKQCFDLIASDKVNYHLHCRKYSDNSGGNENILCFSHRIQLWFKSCSLTSKFIKIQ